MRHIINKNNLFKIIAIMLLMAFSAVSLSANAEEEPFRLHIIANSNSTFDQQVKLKVRDEILKLTAQGLKGASSEKEAEKYIAAHIDEITACADKVLKENGADYSSKAHVGVFEFPDRVYGDKTYPAGDYYALRLVLGKGEGKNWWCVMFPPLCIYDLEEKPENIEIHSALLDWIKNNIIFDYK